MRTPTGQISASILHTSLVPPSNPRRESARYVPPQGYSKLKPNEAAALKPILLGLDIPKNAKLEIYRDATLDSNGTKVPFPYGSYRLVVNNKNSGFFRVRPQRGPSQEKLVEVNYGFSAESGDAVAMGNLFTITNNSFGYVGAAGSTEALHEVVMNQMPIFALSRNGTFQKCMDVRLNQAVNPSRFPKDPLSQFLLTARLSPAAREVVSKGGQIAFFVPDRYTGFVSAYDDSDSTKQAQVRASGNLLVISNLGRWDEIQAKARKDPFSASLEPRRVELAPLIYQNGKYRYAPLKLVDGVNLVDLDYFGFDPKEKVFKLANPYSLERDVAALRNLVGSKNVVIVDPRSMKYETGTTLSRIREWPTIKVK